MSEAFLVDVSIYTMKKASYIESLFSHPSPSNSLFINNTTCVSKTETSSCVFLLIITNTTSLLWSGNRSKRINYSQVAIRTICPQMTIVQKSVLSADSSVLS